MKTIYKSYKSAISDIDDKLGIVIMAANGIGNIDAQKDKSMPGSFTKTLKERLPKGEIYHYKNHFDNELMGVITGGRETEKYLELESKLNLKKQVSKDLFSDYLLMAENGSTLKHSVGVSYVEGKYKDKGGIREVYEWILYEVSTLTKTPANENTPLLGYKNADSVADAIIKLSDYVNQIAKAGIHSEEHIVKNIEYLENLTKIHTILSQSIREHSQPEIPTEPANVAEKDINNLIERIKKIQ